MSDKQSETPKNKIADTTRWERLDSFSSNWNTRNIEMLELIDDALSHHKELTFTEYGCGPNAPFTQAVENSGNRRVIRSDRKKWRPDDFLCDLDRPPKTIPASDVAVLSGVIEYLDDVEQTFELLAKNHDYLLGSYAICTLTKANEASVADMANQIDVRAKSHGWKNHFDFQTLVAILSAHGPILRISTWQTQVIFVTRFCK